ncbi:Segregation and condensation protein B [uncultured archaeon]|nr:Segregation and condensation protein B [uncultured archaeon]
MVMDNTEAEKIIEAALFMSSKPLAVPELGKLIGVAAPGYVQERVNAVKDAYENGGSAIEIAYEEGKYYMRLRQEYVNYVKDFAQATELSKHALRTLAYISKSEGITKRKLFLKLGSSIYSDIQELVENGFVTQKREGRSKSVTTTPKFKAYFGGQTPTPKEQDRQAKLE